MGERECLVLARWTFTHTLSCVLAISLSSHLAAGGVPCNRHIEEEDVAVDFSYSCVQYESTWSSVFTLTSRTVITNETGRWYMKFWRKGTGSERYSDSLTQGNSSFKIDLHIHADDKWLVSVVHIDDHYQETQISHCVIKSCNNDCKWKQKTLSEYKSCKDCVVTSRPRVKVNRNKEVTVGFCTLWKHYPAGAQLQIRTIPAVSNMECDWSEKKYPLRQYSRVPVAVLQESCDNCSESLGMHCVTHKENIAFEVKVVVPNTTTQPSTTRQFSTTTQPITTTGFPSIGQDPSTGQAPSTSQPNGSNTSSTSAGTESESMLPATIGLSFAGVLILVLVLVIAIIRLKIVNYDRAQENSGMGKIDRQMEVDVSYAVYGFMVSENSSNAKNNRVCNNNTSVVEMELEVIAGSYIDATDCLPSPLCPHDAIVLYHAGNKQKARFSRRVIVEGLRGMNIDCTSPEFEKIHDIGISKWVKNTLDSVHVVIAVCCDKFYEAFWAQNQPGDEESAIVFEFARQLKTKEGCPRFISIITDREEQEYVPDTFRDESSIVCLQSLDNFNELVSTLNDVLEVKRSPLGQTQKSGLSVNQTGDDYMLQLKETWDKVQRNITASSHGQGSEATEDDVAV